MGSHDIKERFSDAQSILGGCFEELAAKFLSKRNPFSRGDLPRGHIVTFVSDKRYREVISMPADLDLDVDYLGVEVSHFDK